MIPRNEIRQRIQSQTGLNVKEVIAVLFLAPDSTIETRIRRGRAQLFSELVNSCVNLWPSKILFRRCNFLFRLLAR